MDSLGSEAIIWYFLLEQLQIRGNYIPAGRGQGRVSLGTLRPPPPVLDGGRSRRVCSGLWGWMDSLLGNPSQPWATVVWAGRKSGHSLTHSLDIGGVSAVLSSVLGSLGTKGNNTWTPPAGSSQSSRRVRRTTGGDDSLSAQDTALSGT